MPEPLLIARFAINLPLFSVFDYRLDSVARSVPGQRFRVPFGSGHKVAVLLETRDQSTDRDRELKSAVECLDQEPVLSTHMLALGRWLAEYYCQPPGEVVFQLLPQYLRGGTRARAVTLELWQAKPVQAEPLQELQRRAPKQHGLLLHLMDHPDGLLASDLRQFDPAWRTLARGLSKRDLLSCARVEPLSLEPVNEVVAPQPNAEQSAAISAISERRKGFRVELLDGVTGSGKTEVYLALMQQVLARQGQVIFLVPEIGLTPQLLERVRNRLGPVVVTSHSGQTAFQRYLAWDQFRRGAAGVMLGTRSALFSEAQNLALVVIDEEHDPSYRQQDGLRYHARDVALRRAQMLDIPVILGSATPSTETLRNLKRPHFYAHRLRQRPGGAAMPQMRCIDSGRVNLDHGCSPQLLAAIEQHLQHKGQVLLFLNRRGFAPVMMCHSCGWQATCHQCDARLTLHQSQNLLICHHCGSSQPPPSVCPGCGESQIRHHGIGTEQLQQFIASRFDAVPVIRIDRDSVGDMAQFERLLEPVRSGRPCILVGTQMLAKGHDYPHITLVGILDLDQALFSGFYRAGERLLQTVFQVAGRAGRAQKPGTALLQTAFPDHPLISGLTRKPYDELIRLVLEERRMVGFPPYWRAVMLLADALTLDEALAPLQRLRDFLEQAGAPGSLRIAGPIPALMTRRIGRYRAQLSLMSDDMTLLRGWLGQLLPEIHKIRNTRRMRLLIEVDPADL